MSRLSRLTFRVVVTALAGVTLNVGAGIRLAAAEWPQTAGETDTPRPPLHVSDTNADGIFHRAEASTRVTSPRAADRLGPGRRLVSASLGRSARGVFASPRWWDRLRTDPRRWPQLWPNTTSCTLSLDPITRRHWWER
jgi:hypothetical protein